MPLGLNFTWQCREEPLQDPNNSDHAGCYYRADDEEFFGHELRVNNSLMAENTSYFITIQVTKGERLAEDTQEVFIVPGDPPEVQIRYLRLKETRRDLNFISHVNYHVFRTNNL